MKLYPEIEETINHLNPEAITQERKSVLDSLTEFIQKKIQTQQPINLNFICTHNSRRSHLSQIWAQTLANYFNINNVSCYSAGTEATALFPMVLETLKSQGFLTQTLSEENNPVYAIKYSDNKTPIIGFSKVLDNGFNPKTEFAAIMTCDSANEACPIVSGAEQRIPITYEDPKLFDGTTQQKEKYAERSLQIASEMYYVFSNIKA